MKVTAINGSPRKKWNTAQLLQEALKGAESVGAETELINLYDLNYKGCISCFGCKRKGGTPCHCYLNDDLSLVLETVLGSDVLLLGSPVYFGNTTGEMRSFLERLAFITMTYDDYSAQIFSRAYRFCLLLHNECRRRFRINV
ncbi:flavodoxin family protein [Eggerthella sp. YY7918]|uniref:flavodoxin family protein n=1 Tax=Eggerthella sp. (strain YY7918) TaxID=502558 RepID=UPI0018E09832